MASRHDEKNGWLMPDGTPADQTVHFEGPGITEKELDECPSCHAKNSRGFLVCEAFVEGPKWDTKTSRLGFGGEQLAKPSTLGLVHLEARLCTNCRLVMFHY